MYIRPEDVFGHLAHVLGISESMNLANLCICDPGGFPECVGMCLIYAHARHRICKSSQAFMKFAATYQVCHLHLHLKINPQAENSLECKLAFIFKR